MRSASLVYSIFNGMRINRAVLIEIGSFVEECLEECPRVVDEISQSRERKSQIDIPATYVTLNQPLR